MKERIVSTRSQQDTEKLINNLTKGKSFYLKNWNEKRDFDAQNDGLQELAYAFATLVNDLKAKGIISK
ncbi:MAG: hypothetical protein ACP5N7_06025 [Candidatus Pacearchaeota archaeon]